MRRDESFTLPRSQNRRKLVEATKKNALRQPKPGNVRCKLGRGVLLGLVINSAPVVSPNAVLYPRTLSEANLRGYCDFFFWKVKYHPNAFSGKSSSKGIA